MNKDKKPLDPRWIDELIDHVLGPFMFIIHGKNAKVGREMEEIYHKALTALYDSYDYETTNEWVHTACVRLAELYNAYMTARMIKLMEEGVPEKRSIVTLGMFGGIKH